MLRNIAKILLYQCSWINLITILRLYEPLPLLACLINGYGVNMAGGLSSRYFVIQVQRYFF
ncbi:hypothetical protein AW120_28305 [Escherichia coli]|nr:hypothetical protein AW120_28305 [Escherichia coli]